MRWPDARLRRGPQTRSRAGVACKPRLEDPHPARHAGERRLCLVPLAFHGLSGFQMAILRGSVSGMESLSRCLEGMIDLGRKDASHDGTELTLEDINSACLILFIRAIFNLVTVSEDSLSLNVLSEFSGW